MWFDIIRKKVVSMQVVRDMMHHFSGVFHYSREMPKEIQNSKYVDALSTYHYIQNNMYVIEWDEWDEENAPRVRDIEAYSKKFEKLLKELKEWYNSIPRETKIKSRNLFREINKELNAANSLFLDSDFVFENDRDSWGTYYASTDTSTVNIPNQAKYSNHAGDGKIWYEKGILQQIFDTLSHEFGHQASRSIDSPTWDDPFYEEMLAYLVEYPNNKERAYDSWLEHPDVKESMHKDKSGRKKEIYNKIDIAVKTGAMREVEKDKNLSDEIENIIRMARRSYSDKQKNEVK